MSVRDRKHSGINARSRADCAGVHIADVANVRNLPAQNPETSWMIHEVLQPIDSGSEVELRTWDDSQTRCAAADVVRIAASEHVGRPTGSQGAFAKSGG